MEQISPELADKILKYKRKQRRIMDFILKKAIYLSAVIILFFMGLAAGNYVAQKEGGISNTLPSGKTKKLLFPFFYVKRVTGLTVFCQMVNCIFFMIILGMLLLEKENIQGIFRIYWNFEICYIFFALLFLDGKSELVHIYLLKQKKKSGLNWVPELLQELGGENYKFNGDNLTVIKPTELEGCVFIMLENINPHITGIYYKDIFCRLLDMNYMLLCIDRYPSEDLERYKSTIEKTLSFFHVEEKAFFYMGCEVNSIYETLKINHILKAKGLIWVCESKRKEVMRNLITALKNNGFEALIPVERDTYVVNVCSKDAEENLENWMKEICRKYEY